MNEDDLRIVNIVVTGRLPERLRSLDFNEIVCYSSVYCEGPADGMYAPRLAFRLPNDGENARGKKKTVQLTMWTSGKFIIVGTTNIDDARKYYARVCDELERIKKIIHKN